MQTGGMSQAPAYDELAAAIGISRSYAHQIVNNKRAPRALAIHILRKTGWRHPVIASLSDAQIDTLEAIEPWTRSPEQGVAA